MPYASPVGSDAGSAAGVPEYARHRPEQTLLYRLVDEHYPAFKAHLAAQGSTLPRHLAREFEDFLACGRLENGFPRVACDGCRAEHLVAFSCERRPPRRRGPQTGVPVVSRLLFTVPEPIIQLEAAEATDADCTTLSRPAGGSSCGRIGHDTGTERSAASASMNEAG